MTGLAAAVSFWNRLSRGTARSADPSTAHNNISIVKHNCLSRSNRSLRLVEGDQNIIALHPDLCVRCFMTMPDLCLHPHGPIEALEGNPVQSMRAQSSRAQVIISSHNNLPLVTT